MTKKRTSKSSKNSKASPVLTVLMIIAVLILGGYYLLTGSDPLGLFTEAETTPAPEVAPPAVVGSGGDWWQVYFSDPRNDYDPDRLAGTIPGQLVHPGGFVDAGQQGVDRNAVGRQFGGDGFQKAGDGALAAQIGGFQRIERIDIGSFFEGGERLRMNLFDCFHGVIWLG